MKTYSIQKGLPKIIVKKDWNLEICKGNKSNNILQDGNKIITSAVTMEHTANNFFSTSGPLQYSQYYCHHEICEYIYFVSDEISIQ